MHYIGEIDKRKIKEYTGKVANYKVIITDERIEHIQRRHPGDYEKYIQYIPDIIWNPEYILEDKENLDTIILLKSIVEKEENIQVVIKLQINDKENKYNSILTFWKIRNRNYQKTIQKHKIIYKC